MAQKVSHDGFSQDFHHHATDLLAHSGWQRPIVCGRGLSIYEASPLVQFPEPLEIGRLGLFL